MREARIQNRSRSRVSWVELGELELGARFRFYGIPEQTATLVEKGPGRALIRYDTPRGAGTRTFEARDRRGQKVTRTITPTAPAVEPCALKGPGGAARGS